jgi:cardiolipin synthase
MVEFGRIALGDGAKGTEASGEVDQRVKPIAVLIRHAMHERFHLVRVRQIAGISARDAASGDEIAGARARVVLRSRHDRDGVAASTERKRDCLAHLASGSDSRDEAQHIRVSVIRTVKCQRLARIQQSYLDMTRLKPLAITVGWLLLASLALIGLLSITRGTPLRRVGYGPLATPPEVSDSSFRDIMALFSGVHLESGNSVEQLLNGDGTYPQLWADLRAAQRTITVQMYFSKPGAVADTMAAVLSERARAGVRVLLLFDAFGSQSLKKSWADRLRKAGVRVALLRKLKWYSINNASDRSHVRVVVVDGQVGYTGGFGLADYWLGNGHAKDQWRETNARFTGPSVMELQAAFAAAWVEATGELIVGDAFFPRHAFHARQNAGDTATMTPHVIAGLLYTSPTTGSTPAERFLALSIAGSRRTLYVANSYFVPDDDFRRALVLAAQRGVDVRILTVSEETDVRTTWYAGRARYESLLQGGVRIYEYQPTMMHAKTVVADGVWGSIGSMNFDNRSLAFNNESNLVFWDARVGATMTATFLDDLRYAREIQLAQFRRRPITERMIELSASILSRLL